MSRIYKIYKGNERHIILPEFFNVGDYSVKIQDNRIIVQGGIGCNLSIVANGKWRKYIDHDVFAPDKIRDEYHIYGCGIMDNLIASGILLGAIAFIVRSTSKKRNAYIYRFGGHIDIDTERFLYGTHLKCGEIDVDRIPVEVYYEKVDMIVPAMIFTLQGTKRHSIWAGKVRFFYSDNDIGAVIAYKTSEYSARAMGTVFINGHKIIDEFDSAKLLELLIPFRGFSILPIIDGRINPEDTIKILDSLGFHVERDGDNIIIPSL